MPTQTQKPLEELFFADDRTELNRPYWNRFVREVAVRLRSLDRIRIDWEAVSQQGIDVALARINEVLLPASQRIRDVAELGFLIANSTTERTLVEGEITQFIVEDEDQRDLFTPGPFLAVTRLDTPDDYAVGRLMYFDRETGVLDVQIEAIFGNAGPHSDWQFSAVAGAVQAQVQILATVQGLKGEIETLRNETATDRGLAQDARTGAETAQGLAEAARGGAEDARDAFVALYRGPEAQPLAPGAFVGQLAFDTTDNVMKQWDGEIWNPTVSTSIGGIVSQDFTATAGQTTFTVDGGFTALDVIVNGVTLKSTDDYTLSDPEFTLTAPLNAGDVVQARGYKALDATDYPTKAEAHDTYVRHDTAQSLTPAAQVQARENMGMHGPLAGFRNRIINGGMEIAQRGPTSHSDGSLTAADRWGIFCTGSSVTFNTSRVTNAVTGAGRALLASVTKTDGTGVLFFQRVESLNCLDLPGKRVTIRARVWQGSGGPINAQIRLSRANTADGHGSGLTSIENGPNTECADQTWTDLVFTTTNVLPNEVANGIELEIFFAAGSLSAVDFYLTDVQLEEGPVATPFERRPIGLELSLCQRYYFRTNPVFSIGDYTGAYNGIVTAANANIICGIYNFPENMRDIPSLTTYNPNDGSSTTARLSGTGNFTLVNFLTLGRSSLSQIEISGNTTTGRDLLFQFAADAEL